MAETLVVMFLREYGGDVAGYLQRLGDGQRIGQAFFNSLSPVDQHTLQGTPHDPFHGGQAETYLAIQFLFDRMR